MPSSNARSRLKGANENTRPDKLLLETADASARDDADGDADGDGARLSRPSWVYWALHRIFASASAARRRFVAVERMRDCDSDCRLSSSSSSSASVLPYIMPLGLHGYVMLVVRIDIYTNINNVGQKE
ncbi:hypothetical protein ACKS0A_10364 [Histoplasma ohiense]